jgi:hypothetical protein
MNRNIHMTAFYLQGMRASFHSIYHLTLLLHMRVTEIATKATRRRFVKFGTGFWNQLGKMVISWARIVLVHAGGVREGKYEHGEPYIFCILL